MNRLFIYILALGVFVTATSELVVAGILPAIAEDLHISIAIAGQLITAYSVAFAVGTPIIVSLTSRLERKKVLAGSLAAFILGCLVSFVSTNISILMISRMMLGISSGVYLVVVFSSVAKLVPADKIGGAIGTVILGFSCAMVLGVPLGIAITQWFHWQVIFMMLAIFSLLIMFIIIRLLPTIEGDAPVSFKQQFAVLGNVAVVSGLFLSFFRESGNSVMFTYMTPYLQTILHMTSSEIGVMMLIFGLFGVIGSRLGGYIVDKWGTARLMIGGIAIHALSLVLLPLFSATYAVGLGLIAVMVFTMFVTGPAIQTYFIQQAPESSNLILSLNTSIIHLGLATGAGVGGAIAGAASTVLYNPWIASGIVVLGLAAAIVSVAWGRRVFSKVAA
ncbi:Purine efflux pump PbuE [Paenibacillus allorhizosphaerae]|uniref:Purine efflux pump PbuE n=2 Tax=Paenibacillus allorhizosphaerae TaxID=2849866 RepID=A0ABM8VBL1_9BACL|nr:Purine efflux pump PbuE [Paenibacillus allorhizosphaerae]